MQASLHSASRICSGIGCGTQSHATSQKLDEQDLKKLDEEIQALSDKIKIAPASEKCELERQLYSCQVNRLGDAYEKQREEMEEMAKKVKLAEEALKNQQVSKGEEKTAPTLTELQYIRSQVKELQKTTADQQNRLQNSAMKNKKLAEENERLKSGSNVNRDFQAAQKDLTSKDHMQAKLKNAEEKLTQLQEALEANTKETNQLRHDKRKSEEELVTVKTKLQKCLADLEKKKKQEGEIKAQQKKVEQIIKEKQSLEQDFLERLNDFKKTLANYQAELEDFKQRNARDTFLFAAIEEKYKSCIEKLEHQYKFQLDKTFQEQQSKFQMFETLFFLQKTLRESMESEIAQLKNTIYCLRNSQQHAPASPMPILQQTIPQYVLPPFYPQQIFPNGQMSQPLFPPPPHFPHSS